MTASIDVLSNLKISAVVTNGYQWFFSFFFFFISTFKSNDTIKYIFRDSAVIFGQNIYREHAFDTFLHQCDSNVSLQHGLTQRWRDNEVKR